MKVNYWKITTIILSATIGIMFLSGYLKTRQELIPKREQAIEVTPLKNNVIAGLFIPRINERESLEWTAYINMTNGFSFLFPAKWRVTLSDDKSEIERLVCRGCGGGFSGIKVIYNANPEKLNLRELMGNVELYPIKKAGFTVYVNRQTPGAGEGQTAFITNNDKGDKIVQLYCGGCSSGEMNKVIESFDFRTDRDIDDSWLK